VDDTVSGVGFLNSRIASRVAKLMQKLMKRSKSGELPDWDEVEKGRMITGNASQPKRQKCTVIQFYFSILLFSNLAFIKEPVDMLFINYCDSKSRDSQSAYGGSKFK